MNNPFQIRTVQCPLFCWLRNNPSIDVTNRFGRYPARYLGRRCSSLCTDRWHRRPEDTWPSHHEQSHMPCQYLYYIKKERKTREKLGNGTANIFILFFFCAEFHTSNVPSTGVETAKVLIQFCVHAVNAPTQSTPVHASSESSEMPHGATLLSS